MENTSFRNEIYNVTSRDEQVLFEDYFALCA